jgi:hypothetical protein
VPDFKPISELEKFPIIALFIALLLDVVGLGEVFQQMPLESIVAPPLSVILPPQTAELEVIAVTVFVDIVAKVGMVVFTKIWLPYTVLKEFLAKART